MFLHFAVLQLTSLTLDFLSRVFLGLCWTSSNHRLHISACKCSRVVCAPSRLSLNSGMNLLSDLLTVCFIDSPASTSFILEYVLSLYSSSSILSSAVSNLLQLSSEFFILGYSIFQFHSLFFLIFCSVCVIFYSFQIIAKIVMCDLFHHEHCKPHCFTVCVSNLSIEVPAGQFLFSVVPAGSGSQCVVSPCAT